jgi:hypothetical protein
MSELQESRPSEAIEAVLAWLKGAGGGLGEKLVIRGGMLKGRKRQKRLRAWSSMI